MMANVFDTNPNTMHYFIVDDSDTICELLWHSLHYNNVYRIDKFNNKHDIRAWCSNFVRGVNPQKFDPQTVVIIFIFEYLRSALDHISYFKSIGKGFNAETFKSVIQYLEFFHDQC